jgi:hypothetical protein
VHKIEAPGQLIPFGICKLNACTNELVRQNVPQRTARDGCGKIGGARESPNVAAVLAYQERVGALRNVIQQSQDRSFLMVRQKRLPPVPVLPGHAAPRPRLRPSP